MNEPKEVEGEVIKANKPLKAQMLESDDGPSVIIIDNGLSPDLVYKALAEKGIPTSEVRLVSRSEATPEQLEKADFIRAEEDLKAERRKRDAINAFKTTAMTIDALPGNMPSKSRIKVLQAQAARKKYKEERAKHNDPEVAARIREEKIERKRLEREAREAKKGNK